jgi:hypothetical protein
MSLPEADKGHAITHVLKERSHGGKLGIYDYTSCLVSHCLRPFGREDRPAVHENDVFNIVI